ncbi:hypothetical protein GQX74_012478 [Glossina fuscipes]|nr:hypothetical protein GQX74_012478 [Glossina fuscipes]
MRRSLISSANCNSALFKFVLMAKQFFLLILMLTNACDNASVNCNDNAKFINNPHVNVTANSNADGNTMTCDANGNRKRKLMLVTLTMKRC